jgi:hypothetical protein
VSGTVGRVVDIVGVALVLGLLLRWGPQAAQLIGATGEQLNSFYKTVSLQGIASPQER